MGVRLDHHAFITLCSVNFLQYTVVQYSLTSFVPGLFLNVYAIITFNPLLDRGF